MKKAKVIWSDNALNDLEIIFDFVSEKSLKNGERILKSLLHTTAQLEYFPESGQKQEMIKSTATFRYLIEGNYKLIYNYSKGIIYIHTIFDCRQDPDKIKKEF